MYGPPLLPRGAVPPCVVRCRPQTLHELAGEDNLEGVRALLAGGKAVDERDELGCTALHFAADRGNVDMVRALVGVGADVNAQDDEGQTPLHYAAVTGHFKVGGAGRGYRRRQRLCPGPRLEPVLRNNQLPGAARSETPAGSPAHLGGYAAAATPPPQLHATH
jgi:ankyrin repeat protein